MTSHMLYLSHLDSKDIYPSNTTKDFTVEFNNTLKLEKNATVELVEFRCRLNAKSRASLFVLCDICEYSTAHNGTYPILRSIEFEGKRVVSVSFPNPFKISVREHNLTRCRIYLREENLKDPSFQITDARVTLRINNVCN